MPPLLLVIIGAVIGMVAGISIAPLNEAIVENSKDGLEEKDHEKYIYANLDCGYGTRPLYAVYFHVGKDPVRTVEILNNVCAFRDAIDFDTLLDSCLKTIEQYENPPPDCT